MGKKTALYYVVGLVVGFLVLVIAQSPSSQTKMVVCNVGQGDAILITKGSNQALIDGGPSSEKILSCLARHMPFWDRTIELIVLTNTDFDHMNGLGAVVERYQVIQFVSSDGVHNTEALTHFTGMLSKHGVEVVGVERGDTIQVGEGDGLNFDVLWPPNVVEEYVAVFRNQIDEVAREQILGASAKRGDLNERSVVLLLLEDSASILLTGDAGRQTEEELLQLAGLPDIDVLKVGHHGSRYASTQAFLETIQPEIAVISAGVHNRYGHPTAETLERLSKIGAKIRRTDQEGEVVLEW